MHTRGTQTWLVAIAGTALLLAVGSSAAYAHPRPIKCYQVAEKEGAVNIDVTISDQFHSGTKEDPTGLVGPAENVKIVNPHFFCTPVEEKCIVDPDDSNLSTCEGFDTPLQHFLCWKIAPSGPPVNLDVNATGSEFAFAFESEENPEGKVPVKVQTGQLLCEPVGKEVIEQLRLRK